MNDELLTRIATALERIAAALEQDRPKAPANELPLTDIQAAELLAVPWRKLRKWARDGVMPASVLPDGTFLFDREELADWVKANHVLAK